MFNCFFKYLILFAIVINAISCSNTNNKPIIKFSGDSSSIIIKNIDEASLLQIKNAYLANPDSVNFMSVLLTPGEQDSLQTEEEVSGKTEVAGDSLVFNPKKPFLKGKTYLIESYIGVQFVTTGELLKGGVKHNLQPQQQILTR